MRISDANARPIEPGHFVAYVTLKNGGTLRYRIGRVVAVAHDSPDATLRWYDDGSLSRPIKAHNLLLLKEPE